MNNLAIVIPAYKVEFLQVTLQSIEVQTCKNFHLYIGDDCSPDDVKSIVHGTLKTTPYTYRRFVNNLGGIDLVGHWNRCIEMTNLEEWIWLFSDDDFLSPNCVEFLLKNIENTDRRLFRFNKSVIDDIGYVTRKINYPKEVNLLDFSRELLLENLVTMPEFIFHRSLYEKHSIVNFPLAWGSDKATWLRYINESGNIERVESGIVYYRHSSLNISNLRNEVFDLKKRNADLLFLSWLRRFSKKIAESELRIDFDKIVDLYIDKRIWLFKNSSNFNGYFKLRVISVLVFILPISKALKEVLSILRS